MVRPYSEFDMPALPAFRLTNSVPALSSSRRDRSDLAHSLQDGSQTEGSAKPSPEP